jgi:hypothetical protein
MKRIKSIMLVFAASLLFTPAASAGEADQQDVQLAQAAKEGAKEAPPAAAKRPVYKPPKIGKPAHTVGGGSRGSSDKVPQLFVVVPDHVGQTTSAEPSLFWYVDRVPDPSIRIEFTILDEESIEPKVEAVLPTPKQAGVHRIRLSDHGVKLDPGTEYEWSVSLIVDPNERSKDIVATGFIDRVEGTPQLTARLEGEGQAGLAAVYAEEGLWYDALAALSDQIDRDPANSALREQQADLLRQVGLDEAAASISQ